jgi:general secretion pathway protein D
MHLRKAAARYTLFAAIIASTTLYAQAPPNSPAPSASEQKPIPCSDSVAGPCVPTKGSRKKAKKFFDKGQRELKRNELREAFDSFSMAAKLSPDSFAYLAAREQVRQRLASQLIDRGNQEMLDDHKLQALKSFQQALEIDPGNTFAKQRIYDALPTVPSVRVETTTPGTGLIQLKAATDRRNISVQGPASVALESMARTFGVTAFVDSSVPSRQVTLKLENVSWQEAFDILCRMTKTFWTPLASNQVLFALDDDVTRRTLQRVGLTTFYISSSTPQELNDLTNTLRVMFDIRFITADPSQGTITIRAAQPIVEAASQFVEQLDAKRPQVMIDVHVYAVAQDLTREVGTQIPTSFSLFNVPTEAQKLLGGQSIQDVINQLIASGGINQAATTGIAGLLAQALGGGSSSIFSNPFLTFGGGTTLTGITVPGISGKLSVNESTMHSLQHVSVRASHGNPATIKIGQRFPILNATSAPVFNNPAIARVIGNGSFIAPFPSVSYEDLGIDLKATPKVGRNGIITVDLEMQIRALQGTSVNGVPVLTNREFKGTMSTKDGESIVVAGLISKSEQRSLAGVPGLSQIPLVGTALFTEQDFNKNDDEVLVVMTPRIVGGATTTTSPAIALPSFIQR